jgi:prepilin-type N-terminal cleavage/methylation domain-containing protein
VCEIRQGLLHARRDERGLTLSELLMTIAIVTVLVAIAVVLFLAP